MRTIGEYVRELRNEKGLTLRELADALDVDVTYISKIELGTRNLSRELIPGLAKAFQEDKDEFNTTILAMMAAEQFGKEKNGLESLKMAVKQLEKKK